MNSRQSSLLKYMLGVEKEEGKTQVANRFGSMIINQDRRSCGN